MMMISTFKTSIQTMNHLVLWISIPYQNTDDDSDNGTLPEEPKGNSDDEE